MDAKLRVEHVDKEFDHRHETVTALKDVSFAVGGNEFVALVGSSGCGKSTLLAVIAGLEPPTRGQVLLGGKEVIGPGRDRGFVFQTYTLFPWMTARANVEFALRDEPLSRQERRRVADEHLARVGLSRFADAYPRQLSGGMRQRVAIARALSYRPEVLLMDEPFGALDALTRETMQELLTEVWEAHRLAVVFVTHDIDEALLLSDRILLMARAPGRIDADITVGFDRPRKLSLMSDVRFQELRSELRERIRRSETLATAHRPGLLG